MTHEPEHMSTQPEIRESEGQGFPTFRITVQTREPLGHTDPELAGKDVILESDLPPALNPFEIRYVQDPQDETQVFRMMGFAHTTDGILIDNGEIVTETRRNRTEDAPEEIQAGTESIRRRENDINAVAEALQQNADDTVIVRRVYIPGEQMQLALSLNASEVSAYGLRLEQLQHFASQDDTEGKAIPTESAVIMLPVADIDSTQWFKVVAKTRTGRIIEVRLTQTTTDTDTLQVQQELRGLQYKVNADPEEIKRFEKAMQDMDAEARAEREDKLERERRKLALEQQIAETSGKASAVPKITREQRAALREQAEQEARRKTFLGIPLPQFKKKS